MYLGRDFQIISKLYRFGRAQTTKADAQTHTGCLNIFGDYGLKDGSVPLVLHACKFFKEYHTLTFENRAHCTFAHLA